MNGQICRAMGITYTKVKVRNPLTESKTIELDAKIDTGATLLVLPGDVANELKFPFVRKTPVKYADESRAERDVVGAVELEACGRKAWFEAIVEPKKSYALVGAIVMETLDLIIEPRSLGVYPNPRSPDAPLTEIE
jgi:clan AA aspartic protease